VGGGFHRPDLGLKRFFHFFAQATAGAEETKAHGDDRNRKAVGDFLRRVVHDVAKQAGLSEVRGKLKNCIREFAAHFAARALFLGISGMRGEERGERFFGVAAGFFKREMFAVAALAQCVDGSVAGDAREPRAEVVGVVFTISGKLIEARPCFQESFLANVFGIGDVASDAASALKQRWDVRRHHFGEGFAIAAACARN